MTEIKRDNKGKARYSLLPQPLVDAEAAVYTAGARKYQPWGWLKYPLDEEETLDSAFRHIKAYRAGESFDPETGAHHLTSARWNLGVLFMYEYAGLETPGDRAVFRTSAHFAANQIKAEATAALYLARREAQLAEAEDARIDEEEAQLAEAEDARIAEEEAEDARIDEEEAERQEGFEETTSVSVPTPDLPRRWRGADRHFPSRTPSAYSWDPRED